MKDILVELVVVVMIVGSAESWDRLRERLIYTVAAHFSMKGYCYYQALSIHTKPSYVWRYRPTP